MTRFRVSRRGLRARRYERPLAALAATILAAGAARAQELVDGRVDVQRKITAASSPSLVLDVGDQFGRAVTSIGDLDGDGITELAVGALNDDDGGTQGLESNTGAVWILFMRSNGGVRSATKVGGGGTGGFAGHLDNMDQFGRAVTALGDVDSDGIPDIAVGSARDDDGGNNRGAVWILFLNADGSVKGHQKISDIAGNFTAPLRDFDEFGRSIAPIGDLDGDNVLDLVVGAIGDDDGGSMRGAVYVLFMNPDFTVKSYQKISQTRGNFVGQLHNGDAFGIDVAQIGDLNNDGVPDIAVGAPKDPGLTYREGALWILFLESDGTCKWQQRINRMDGGFTGIWHHCYEFGTSVTSLGDIDRDGVQDLAVGAILDGELGQGHGAVWILFMNSNGTVKGQGKINDAHGGFDGTLGLGDWFGSSVASIGDLDGNGTRDLAVGARYDDQTGDNTGAVYVMMLDGAKQARLTFRNGSQVNPVAYSSLLNPVMGATWVGSVNTSAQPDIYLTYLIGFNQLLATPLPTAFGELIIDVTSALFLLTSAGAMNGSSTHFVPVPIDPALEGFTIYTQAMGFGNQIYLFNGLDLYVGY